MSSSDASPAGPTPESEGIPDYADDDSTAFDEADRPRFRDSPPSLPAEGPQAVEDSNMTAEGQRRGLPLDERLSQEQPDAATQDQWPAGSGRALADEVVTEDTERQAGRDTDVLGAEPGTAEPESVATGTAQRETGEDGAASVYDEADPSASVGRLVEPDEGARTDTEKAALAGDAGAAGEGAGPEEQAMREMPEDELGYEP